MPHSPHLPPPSSSVRFYHKTRSIGRTLALVVIAGLAGMTSSLATEAWLMPTIIPDGGIYAFERNRQNNAGVSLDPALESRVEQRIVTLYDRREQVGGTYYPSGSEVGRAVFLSLDGWAVMHLDEYVPGAERQWDAIDYKGSVFSVERVVVDRIANLMYVKVNGDGFRVSSIAMWPEITGTHVWVAYEDAWEASTVARAIAPQTEDGERMWQQRPTLRLSETHESGVPLFSATGELLGFAEGENTVIPSFFVNVQLNSLLEDGTVLYEAPDWSGSILPAVQHPTTGQKVAALYISQTATPNNTDGIRRGDVVVALNGASIDPEYVGNQLLALPHEFTATVMRDGEIRDILVTKQVLPL